MTCVNTVTTGALQRSQLETILDTVYPVAGNHMPFTTLITPNRGIKMYSTETNFDPLTTYQVMLNDIKHGIIPTTNDIWTNYSPCPDCVAALINLYEQGDKPTIHVAQVYTHDSNVSDTLKTLKCLAKLEHAGFSVVPWNFNEFKDHSSFIHELCKEKIDAYFGSEKFNDEYSELVDHLEFINQLSQNPHVNSWCECCLLYTSDAADE